jgi:hypothetical protein
MQINYSQDAFATLVSLLNFIEEKNTEGAAIRWLNKFEIFLHKDLKNHQFIHFCRNEVFKSLQLKCIYYNDWLIAFSEKGESILIEVILHKSRISG